jgi:hypothetical protein
VAQGVGPEFKAQYHEKQKQTDFIQFSFILKLDGERGKGRERKY